MTAMAISQQQKSVTPVHILLFVSIGLFPFVPTELNLRTALFPTVFTILAFAATYDVGRRQMINRRFGIILVFLIYLIAFNGLISLYFGTSLSKFARGLVPFVFLISYEVFRRLALRTQHGDEGRVVQLLVLSALAWAFAILIKNYEILPNLLNGQILRLTYFEKDMLIPFGLVGFILVIYGNRLPNVPVAFLVVLFLMLVIVSGYRSQFALVFAIMLYRFRNLTKLRSILGLAAIFVLFGFLVITYWHIVATILNRFGESGGDDVRSAEIAYAKTNFWQSPIFGKGLGFVVPVELTRSIKAVDLFEVDNVSYIHNITYYFLMDTGLVGFILFVLCIVPHPRNIIKALLGKYGTLAEGLMVTLLTLIVYFHISASFRQIQMIVVVSFLVAILDVIARRHEAGEIR